MEKLVEYSSSSTRELNNRLLNYSVLNTKPRHKSAQRHSRKSGNPTESSNNWMPVSTGKTKRTSFEYAEERFQHSERMSPFIYPLILLLYLYRLTLSPILGNQCRFYPTCSHYAEQALRKHGALKGSSLAVQRLLRCHPWHDGGYDPVQ